MQSDRSKSSSNKAAGEVRTGGVALRYVEDFDEPRTLLAAIFSGY